MVDQNPPEDIQKNIADAERAKKPISEIEPVGDWERVIVRRKIDLTKHVEAPLLKACYTFWDKNIQTFASSANKKDIAQGGYVSLAADSLSSENREIADKLGGVFIENYRGKGNIISFRIPISPHSTLGEVEQVSSEIADAFEKQPMTWAQTYSLADLKKVYAYDEADEASPVDFETYGYYYDTEAEIFYDSDEYYQKVKAVTVL